eukprot:s2756_g12.t1
MIMTQAVDERQLSTGCPKQAVDEHPMSHGAHERSLLCLLEQSGPADPYDSLKHFDMALNAVAAFDLKIPLVSKAYRNSRGTPPEKNTIWLNTFSSYCVPFHCFMAKTAASRDSGASAANSQTTSFVHSIAGRPFIKFSVPVQKQAICWGSLEQMSVRLDLVPPLLLCPLLALARSSA